MRSIASRKKMSDLIRRWIEVTGASETETRQRYRRLRESGFLSPSGSAISDVDVADFIIGMLAGEDNLKASNAAMDLTEAIPVWTQASGDFYKKATFGRMLALACRIARKNGVQLIDRLEIDAVNSGANIHFHRNDSLPMATIYMTTVPPGTPDAEPITEEFLSVAAFRKPRDGVFRIELVRVMQGEVLMQLAVMADDRVGRESSEALESYVTAVKAENLDE